MTTPFVHQSSIVDDGVHIGDGSKIWHFCHILAGSRIGNDCVLGQNVMVGPNVQIGDGVKIQNNVSVFEGVTIEDDVFCAPGVVFTNVKQPRAFINRREEFAPTLICKGATLGANATVVCGINIGRYAFIGAGAVVTHDVPDHALVVGTPALQIGWVGIAGRRLSSDLVCPETGLKYTLSASGLKILAKK